MPNRQTVTIAVTGTELEAINWLMNRPKTHTFAERQEALKHGEAVLKRVYERALESPPKSTEQNQSRFGELLSYGINLPKKKGT